MAKARAVTDVNLGAWIFKCSPGTWDLAGFLADGERDIDNWSVRESYRLDLFETGQRAFFWASEGHEGIEAGILGEGTVTGRFIDGTGSDYWIDDEEAAQLRTFAGLELALLNTLLPRRGFVADPVLAKAEVIRQPWSSNPSFLTKDQVQSLDRLVRR